MKSKMPILLFGPEHSLRWQLLVSPVGDGVHPVHGPLLACVPCGLRAATLDAMRADNDP